MSRLPSAQRAKGNTDNIAITIASVHPSQKLQEFLRFPDLPMEIRFKIWKLSLPGPRTVVIASRENYQFKNARPSDLQVRFRQALVKVITKVPIQLHTSREARQEAMMHYQLAFKEKLDGCPAWFDFGMDALYISDNLAVKYFFEKFTIRPGQGSEPQWQLENIRTQLRQVVFADEKMYQYSGALFRNLEALETAVFPRITRTSMSLITSNKQTANQFLYFIKVACAPYEHSKSCKLRTRFVNKSSMEICRKKDGLQRWWRLPS